MNALSLLSLWAGDSATMLRRRLLHVLRMPSIMVILIGFPVVFLLLFVYVFGGALGAGLGAAGADGASYVDYVTPGILLMTVASIAQITATYVAMDMSGGIVARFRTMAISRASILTGQVLGAMVQTTVAVAVVTGVALLIGFRPTAGPLEWLAALGVILMVSWAVTWLMVAAGLVLSYESASNAGMPLTILPFLGSGFVPTDSMPTALRWFAEYQPFTPVIETLRGLLMNEPIGNSAILAVAWCVVITLVGFLWARSNFERKSAV